MVNSEINVVKLSVKCTQCVVHTTGKLFLNAHSAFWVCSTHTENLYYLSNSDKVMQTVPSQNCPSRQGLDVFNHYPQYSLVENTRQFLRYSRKKKLKLVAPIMSRNYMDQEV